MKLLEIYYEFVRGSWTSGSILKKLIAAPFIALSIGVGLIFKFGFRVLIIFVDECQSYLRKGNASLYIVNRNLKLFDRRLMYYFHKTYSFAKSDQSYPKANAKLPKKFLLSFLGHLFLSVFYYAISIIALVLSFYWILTYTQLFLEAIKLIPRIWGVKDFFDNQTLFLTALDTWSIRLFSLSIFTIVWIWVIRIAGFAIFFITRFKRLEGKYRSLVFSDIFSYNSPFWQYRVSTHVNWKLLRIISIAAFVLAVLISIWFYISPFSNADAVTKNKPVTSGLKRKSVQDPHKSNVPVRDSITHVSTRNVTSVPDNTNSHSLAVQNIQQYKRNYFLAHPGLVPDSNQHFPFVVEAAEAQNNFYISNQGRNALIFQLSVDGYRYDTFTLETNQHKYYAFINYSGQYFRDTTGHIRVCTGVNVNCVGSVIYNSRRYGIGWINNKSRWEIFAL